MKKGLSQFAVIFLFLFSMVSINCHANAFPFNKIVFFGDSLTDNGNLYDFIKIMPKSPPYYKGRFSNGPTWAEVVADHFLKTHGIKSENFAVGGETVLLISDGKTLPYTIDQSIESYIWRNLFSRKDQTLFVFWLGANDYLAGDNDVAKLTSAVSEHLIDEINRLIAEDAKYFLILNLPDLDKTPRGASGGITQNLHDLTVAHNTILATKIAILKQVHPGRQIYLYNINALFSDVLNHMDKYNEKYHTHLAVTDKSCWLGGYTQKELANDALSYRFNNPDLRVAELVTKHYLLGEQPCANPDDYIFWDHVHPTKIVHGLLAEEIIAALEQSMIFKK
jgi:phospholipase/lecithinase/hemolysin